MSESRGASGPRMPPGMPRSPVSLLETGYILAGFKVEPGIPYRQEVEGG